jgi:hypothetical protein
MPIKYKKTPKDLGEFEPLFKKWKELYVCPEWQDFEVFKEWSIAQGWVGKYLSNKHINPKTNRYSPKTSLWLEPKVFAFLFRHKARGLYPLGVSEAQDVARQRRYLSRCGNPFTGKTEYLGKFKTVEQAHEAWRKRRHELAIQLAETQTNPQIIKALHSRYVP